MNSKLPSLLATIFSTMSLGTLWGKPSETAHYNQSKQAQESACFSTTKLDEQEFQAVVGSGLPQCSAVLVQFVLSCHVCTVPAAVSQSCDRLALGYVKQQGITEGQVSLPDPSL